MVRKVRSTDIEQQEGRIIRQGNQNPEVKIFRYLTKSTFDSYSYQLLEQKQKFIGQIMTSKSPVRSAEDIDEAALSYAEVKALASGNPMIKEKMELDNDVARLKMIKANYQSQIYQMQDDISVNFPKQIAQMKALIAGLEQDVETAKAIPVLTDEKGKSLTDVTVVGKQFHDRKDAGLAIIAACAGLKAIDTGGEIGSYGGFALSAAYDSFSSQFLIHIQGKVTRTVNVSKDSPTANINLLENAVAGIADDLAKARQQLETVEQQLQNAMIEVQKPFPQEQELADKLARLSELNRALDNDAEREGRRTSDIVADMDTDHPCKPSIRDRLRAAQTRNAQRSTPERTQHRNHDLSL